jgi:phenylacetate-CoA ligase
MPDRSALCWNADMETMALPARSRIEDERLRRQLAYVQDASAFYRGKWAQAGIAGRDVQSVEALARLPFTEKRELQEAQNDPPPFGANQCVAVDRLIRMQATGGTSGEPLRMALTRRDVETYNELGARAGWAAGLRPGDILLECMNYSLYAGGVNDHMTFEALGACVAPVGVGQSRRLLDIVRQMRTPVALYATPSYALHLAEVAEAAGLRPADLGIRRGLLSGDAGLGIPEYRRRIEDTWGMEVRDIYGLGELAPLAAECGRAAGLHWLGHGLMVAELVDPATGTVMPATDGGEGELVFTTLEREAHPLVRFRSHDHVQILGAGCCECGRTGFRFRVLGRSDDMFIVKGINVYPLGVQSVIASLRPAVTGEFQIVLEEPPPLVRPPRLRVEHEDRLGPEDLERLHDRLARRIREVLMFTPEIELVPRGALPAGERKARRLVRAYVGEERP